MKKLFFIAAIAGAALVSCTKNELAPSVTAQEEISFAAPVVGAQTKAVYGAIGATYDKAESFDVWSKWNKTEIAAWGGTDYIVDKPVTHNAATPGGWHFTPAYYWPADGYLSFVALSPSITNSTTYDATNGFKISGWSQGATEAAIVDLMYSEPSLNHKEESYSTGDNDGEGAAYTYEGVDIMFRHALSYITFKVKTSANYAATTLFKLNTITLDKIYTTGSFVQKPANSTDPNWTIAEDDKDKLGKYIAFTNESGASFGYASKDAGTQTELSATSAKGKEIILLPQALTGGQQKLIIDYQISTDEGANWIPQTQTIDLADAAIDAWKMGKKYIYTLSISMTEIILDPAVDDWDDYEPEPGVTL